MGPRVYSLLLSLVLSSFLLLLPFLSQATFSGPFRHVERFGSFKHLEGSKKGEKREGIQKVKQYLQRYGYLNFNSVSHPQYSEDSDDFDDVLESSLKAFQNFYHLTPTGILDDPTAALMSRARCGFPDHPPSGNSIHPDYTFLEDVKWPADLMHLHYIFYPENHPEEPITKSFDAWAAGSNFTFERVRDEKFAEILLHFGVRDGPGTILGKASPTIPKTRIEFDREECWADGAEPHCYDLQSLATHEIGHILGLGHSHKQRANMYPLFLTNSTKPLTQDDFDGVRAKYNT